MAISSFAPGAEVLKDITCSGCADSRLVEGVRVRALSFAAAFTGGRSRSPCEHHLSLNHHRGKLSIGAVYRSFQDDRAPPHMDRYSNGGKSPRPTSAKDVCLRLDRGGPKPSRDIEPGQ